MTSIAEEIVARLLARAETLAVAESLTGGLVAGAITEVPGCSAVFRGGVVAYATDLKHVLLGVPSADLAADGPVHVRTARSMADGVRARLAATWGVATTGVAGPSSQDGIPPGTVHLAVAGPAGRDGRSLRLEGDRPAVRAGAVAAVLDLLLAALADATRGESRGQERR